MQLAITRFAYLAQERACEVVFLISIAIKLAKITVLVWGYYLETEEDIKYVDLYSSALIRSPISLKTATALLLCMSRVVFCVFSI